mgnify:CR=1 FL=1
MKNRKLNQLLVAGMISAAMMASGISVQAADVKGLKIGVPKEYFGEGINSEVKEKLQEAMERYKKLGATIEECSVQL